MPSTERFRARPMWACLEPCPFAGNYQFRVGQQPKPQIGVLVLVTLFFRTLELKQTVPGNASATGWQFRRTQHSITASGAGNWLSTGRCIALNIGLLAAFVSDVDLQGRTVPCESADSGQHLTGSQKLNLRRCQKFLPESPNRKSDTPPT